MKKPPPRQTVFENIRPLPPHEQDATTIALLSVQPDLIKLKQDREEKK